MADYLDIEMWLGLHPCYAPDGDHHRGVVIKRYTRTGRDGLIVAHALAAAYARSKHRDERYFDFYDISELTPDAWDHVMRLLRLTPGGVNRGSLIKTLAELVDPSRRMHRLTLAAKQYAKKEYCLRRAD